jgi:hypothetical protein
MALCVIAAFSFCWQGFAIVCFQYQFLAILHGVFRPDGKRLVLKTLELVGQRNYLDSHRLRVGVGLFLLGQ